MEIRILEPWSQSEVLEWVFNLIAIHLITVHDYLGMNFQLNLMLFETMPLIRMFIVGSAQYFMNTIVDNSMILIQVLISLH